MTIYSISIVFNGEKMSEVIPEDISSEKKGNIIIHSKTTNNYTMAYMYI